MLPEQVKTVLILNEDKVLHEFNDLDDTVSWIKNNSKIKNLIIQ